MTLEFLQKEMILAMKARDKERKDVLSSMVSAVKKAAIDKKCKDNISEELVSEVLLKEKKTMEEMIDTCPTERAKTLAAYKYNLSIIEEFAPKLIADENEIKDIILASGIELTKVNRGQFMRLLKGKADMKIVNKIVSELLR